LGHGLYTAQTQLIAEELSVPFSRVKLIQCDTAAHARSRHDLLARNRIRPQFPIKGLSLSQVQRRAKRCFRWHTTRLGVAVDQLTAKDGVVSAKADASKR
jgi:hypothetical protein